MRRVASLLAWPLLGTLLAAAPAAASPGDLDPAFSRDGKVVSGWRGWSVASQAYGFAAVGADSKPVLAASVSPAKRKFAFSKIEIGVARFTEAGVRDKSFSKDGRVIIHVPDRQDLAGVAVADDGSVYLASTSRNDIIVTKVDPRGRPDRKFGDKGVFTLDFGLADTAIGIGVQPDGSIIVGGTATLPAPSADLPSNRDLVVAALTPSGALDPSFAGDGVATIDFTGESTATAPSQEQAIAMDVGADGRVVVLSHASAKTATAPYRAGDLALVVLSPDGNGDPGFDANGQVLLDLEINGAGVAVADDGAISITGGYQDTQNFNVARITAAGQPDPTFAGDGVAIVDGGGGEDISDAAVVDDQGRTLIAGSTEGARSTTDYALVRMTQTGEPDRAFSEDGKLTIEFDIGKKYEYDDADAVILDREGRILVGGTVGEHKLGVSRHLVTGGGHDFDADGVADRDDRCPERYGTRSNGCPSRGQQTR